MKIKQLIKKSISQKTLFTDVFGYSLTKTGFADKYLAGQPILMIPISLYIEMVGWTWK